MRSAEHGHIRFLFDAKPASTQILWHRSQRRAGLRQPKTLAASQLCSNVMCHAEPDVEVRIAEDGRMGFLIDGMPAATWSRMTRSQIHVVPPVILHFKSLAVELSLLLRAEPDVEVRIPEDGRMRFLIDAMAAYVLEDGCDFEHVRLILACQLGLPTFAHTQPWDWLLTHADTPRFHARKVSHASQ